MRLCRLPSVAVISLLLVSCQSRDSTPADWKSFPIGKGQVRVSAPTEYKQSLEPDETLVLTPPNDPGVTLRFNLHYMEGPGVPSDVGLKFVRAQAKKKQLTVTEMDGKIFLTEVSSGDERGGKVERRFWQIGFENAVVVMSATVVDAKKDAPEVKECLEKTVPLIIGSLRK